jgi:amino acid adenylation domain-containing protein
MTGDLADRLRRLSRQRRADLLERLRDTSSVAARTTTEAAPAADGTAPPRAVASFQQEQMWFVDRLSGGRARNNSNQGLRLHGPLDVAALSAALDDLCQRHEILRTTLVEADGTVYQQVHDDLRPELRVVDVSGLAADERDSRVDELRTAHAATGFDLERGPLAAGLLIRLAPADHLLLWVAHHIIWDPGSRQVFVDDLLALYRARASGVAANLPELSTRYVDFAAEQHRHLAVHGSALAAYWSRQLSGLQPTEVRPDRPRPAKQTFAGTRTSRQLDPEVLDRLDRLARARGTTLFMSLLAAVSVVLSRHTGTTDITVGTASMIRRRPELQRILGCFVNMLVLRTDLSGDPTFGELLARVRETVLDAFSHEQMPFEKVVEAVNPRRDTSRNPLFQIELTAFNAERAALDEGDLRVELVAVPDEVSRFDLSILAVAGGDGLGLAVEYNTDLYGRDTMDRFLAQLETLLRDVTERPEAHLSELRICPTQERALLVGAWSRGPAATPPESTVDRLVAEQVVRRGDHPAVVCGSVVRSYAELGRRAGGLARRLRELGAGPDERVALLVDRNADLPAAVLGVLGAGAAYVPIDPTTPPRRVSGILDDAGVVALVADATGLAAGFEGPPPLPTVVLDGPEGWPAWQPDGWPAGRPDAGRPLAVPGNLAYVIYTSGTTGTPKGVMVEHRSVVDFVEAIRKAYEITEADRVAQFASLAFDVSVFDIFSALASGATVVVLDDRARRNPDRLVAALREHRVTVAELPPALVPMLDPADLPDLRLLSLGGEPFAGSLAARWTARGVTVFNGYGPTETTVAVTLARCPGQWPDNPPIGRPMAGHQALVLDPAGQPSPVGVAGELCIAGPGVARGYLGRPGLTAERFVRNPYGGGSTERMYRTGDLARWRADGTLELLGRLDRQLKVRGYRVEPQEIEAALATCPEVRAVVVEPYERPGQERELVAYLQLDGTGEPEVSRLRAFLAARLPPYMVPAYYVALPQLPRTPTGKIDRAALPAPGGDRPNLGSAYQAPRDGTEKVLAEEIFAPLLGVSNVGILDNFFELGGSSLAATRLLAQVTSRFGVRVDLADFFDEPTVAGVAEQVRRGRVDDRPEDRMRGLLERIEDLSDEEAEQFLELFGEDPTRQP